MNILIKKRIPLNNSFDVIVVGGGPAGCTAACASAREGAKTLLIEATGALGGMGTMGLVPAWCPFTDKEKIIYRGLAEKILFKTMDKIPHASRERLDWRPIDPELLKRIYDELMEEYGVTVLFNTFVCDVEAKNGIVNYIIASNKAGLTAYKAKVFVDCTGDADIAAWAGADYQKGNEKGEMQPATHCFIITNVDMYGYMYCGSIRREDKEAIINKILASGKYPEIKDPHACNTLIGPSTIGFNAGHIWDVDNTDPFSVSKALVEGRKIAKAFHEALKEFFPQAFANSFLVATAPLLGARETRRIVGDYILTLADWLERKSFPDEICRNSYWIDIHTAKDEIQTAIKFGSKKVVVERYEHYKPGESHGIPYRCLIPKKLKNVLVAGRSISTDRPVQGSIRVMPTCLAMGEAAGMAAGMSLKYGGIVRKVDVNKLRKRLKEEGVYLPDIN